MHGSRETTSNACDYTRLNDHYRPASVLARLLLDNLTLVDRRGEYSTAASFMVDMNDLFERFVTERLGRASGGSPGGRRARKDDYLDDGRGTCRSRPDLLFHHPSLRICLPTWATSSTS